MFTEQAWSSRLLTSIVHILSPETAFLNQQKAEIDRRKYFMINLHERMLPTSAGVEPATSGLQSDEHPTEPQRQTHYDVNHCVTQNKHNL